MSFFDKSRNPRTPLFESISVASDIACISNEYADQEAIFQFRRAPASQILLEYCSAWQPT
jgi:hypothetical protein